MRSAPNFTGELGRHVKRTLLENGFAAAVWTDGSITTPGFHIGTGGAVNIYHVDPQLGLDGCRVENAKLFEVLRRAYNDETITLLGHSRRLRVNYTSEQPFTVPHIEIM